MLLSLSEFNVFKELMLAYKQESVAKPQQQLVGLQCCAMKLHREEQEDGEARPDLDMTLVISPVMSPTSKVGGGVRTAVG